MHTLGKPGSCTSQTMPNDSTSEFTLSDAVTDLEHRFPFRELLSLDYFQRHRAGYYDCREHGWQIPRRNYYSLLTCLTEIHEYRTDDAKAFAKRFRTEASDLSNADATFAEMIVSRYYVRLVYEGLIRAVRLDRGDCDVVIERLDGSCAFLEVFSVKPRPAMYSAVASQSVHEDRQSQGPLPGSR